MGDPSRLNRRKFIHSSATVAAGAAAAAVPGAAVLSAGSEPAARPIDPSTPSPAEPVMAYVRDARRGEVTVLSGTREVTYRDPALTKRLLDAAPATLNGGETDVVAP